MPWALLLALLGASGLQCTGAETEAETETATATGAETATETRAATATETGAETEAVTETGAATGAVTGNATATGSESLGGPVGALDRRAGEGVLSIRVGRAFGVRIENVSKRRVSFIAAGIERWDGRGWGEQRRDIDCPCRAMCKKKAVELEPGGVHSSTWDLEDDGCRRATAGSYRARVTGAFDAGLERNLRLGVSPTFAVE